MSMTNEELAIRIQGGESDLLGELWQQNIGAFHNKAYQLYNSRREQCTAAGVEADDVVQCCYFALCDAVKAFTPIRNIRSCLTSNTRLKRK